MSMALNFLLLVIGIIFTVLNIYFLSDICFWLLPFTTILCFLFGAPYVIRRNISSYKRLKRGESIFRVLLLEEEEKKSKSKKDDMGK